MATRAPILLPRAPRSAETTGADPTVERGVEEVTAAILLVADRRPSTVLVCNLAHCMLVVDSVRELAVEAGVDLDLIARPDGRGHDIAVRAR